MNINQAQQLSGVSSDNIRFYEKQGLLCPRRNRANDYREYSEDDIRTLKLIRILRMLDMPLPQIRTVLAGDVPLSQAAQLQRQRLTLQAQQLESAIRLCEEFSAHASLEALDVDGLLHRMDTPEQAEGFFRGWLQDYRRVALSEHEKRFTFVPDEAVTTPQEFSNALFQYARENGLDLVITKEGMYPEFTIDGIEYTATRNYGRSYRFPVATIHCEVRHPEDFEPLDISPTRRKLQRLFHHLWVPALLFLLLLLTHSDLLTSWEGRVLLGSLMVVTGVMSFRSWLLFYNENGKQGKK